MRKLWLALGLVFSLSVLSSWAYAGPKVEFKTNLGNFVVDLDSDKDRKSTRLNSSHRT